VGAGGGCCCWTGSSLTGVGVAAAAAAAAAACASMDALVRLLRGGGSTDGSLGSAGLRGFLGFFSGAFGSLGLGLGPGFLRTVPAAVNLGVVVVDAAGVGELVLPEPATPTLLLRTRIVELFPLFCSGE
jgi:hypothetical protein